MRGLKITLWLTGVLCLPCVVGLFLPLSSLASFTSLFGVETLPDSPVVIYGTRTVSATFVAVGIFFIILALNPMKYGVLVPFSGLASVFVGVVCAITGPVVGMPAKWFLGDSLSCLILGVLILFFWKRAKRVVAV
ncbi:MAG: hypothetical protein PHY02_10970 [Phycisphaerae bacterium]|nr:hypothetical protein [Phycisphaerae bacterium]